MKQGGMRRMGVNWGEPWGLWGGPQRWWLSQRAPGCPPIPVSPCDPHDPVLPLSPCDPRAPPGPRIPV